MSVFFGPIDAPFRMNLVDIEIKTLIVADTIIDEDYGQPVTEKNREVIVTLKGQVNFGPGKTYLEMVRSRSSNYSMMGDVPKSQNHILFKNTTLADAGYTPKKDDVVLSCAGVPCGFIIKQVKPYAPLRGAMRLTECQLRTNDEEA